MQDKKKIITVATAVTAVAGIIAGIGFKVKGKKKNIVTLEPSSDGTKVLEKEV